MGDWRGGCRGYEDELHGIGRELQGGCKGVAGGLEGGCRKNVLKNGLF